MRKGAVVVAIGWWIGLAGCGANHDAMGPNYSTTSCSQNCGNDTQCQAHCTDISEPNGPPPIGNNKR